LLVVLEELGLPELRALGAVLRKSRQYAVVVPLFLTREHIQSSLDTFPLELLEIRDNHVTVYGEELLEGLRFELENLRLQCEREIKSRLIQLRQAYFTEGGKAKYLQGLLERSLISTLPIMRGLLRLAGEQPPVERAGVLEAVARRFQVDPEAFLAVLAAREEKERLPLARLEELFAEYLEQLERLAEVVDRWEKAGDKEVI